MYNSFIIMLNAVHAIDIILVQSYNVPKCKLLWGGWMLLENGQCQILIIEVTIFCDFIVYNYNRFIIYYRLLRTLNKKVYIIIHFSLRLHITV